MQAENKASRMSAAERFSMSGEMADIARRFGTVTPARPKLTCEFTTDIALLHLYRQLREDMFIRVWGMTHTQGSKDAFDDKSETIVARRGRLCVGGARLTLCTPASQGLLPMEGPALMLRAIFPELDLAETTYGEFSRLAIMPDLEDRVLPEMLQKLLKRMIVEGAEYAFCITSVPEATKYRKALAESGMNVEMHKDLPLPDREEYDGVPMVLAVIDLSKQLHAARMGKRTLVKPLADA